MPERKHALVTGYSIILMAALAGYTIGYALPQAQMPTYDAAPMLTAFWGIALLDLIVSVSLCHYFGGVGSQLSQANSATRIIYTAIFSLAIFQLHSIEADPLVSTEAFNYFWSLGLIVFGVHLFLMGLLVYRSFHLPNFIALLLYIAGISYTLIHTLKLIQPAGTLASELEMVLGIPMALSELLLAFFLILRHRKKVHESVPAPTS